MTGRVFWIVVLMAPDGSMRRLVENDRPGKDTYFPSKVVELIKVTEEIDDLPSC